MTLNMHEFDSRHLCHPARSAIHDVCSVCTVNPQKAPKPAQSLGVLDLGIKALIDQSQPVMSLTSPQSSKQYHPQDSDLPGCPPSRAVVVLLLVPMFVSCLIVSNIAYFVISILCYWYCYSSGEKLTTYPP
jgi:hypothetical protein